MGLTWDVREDSILARHPRYDGTVHADYTAMETTIELTDNSGPFACPGKTGVYEWDITDDVLTLTLVSDECLSRPLDGIEFERVD